MKLPKQSFHSSYRGPRNTRNSQKSRLPFFLTAGIGAAAVLSLGIWGIVSLFSLPGPETISHASSKETVLSFDPAPEEDAGLSITVNGISSEGMTRQEFLQALKAQYPWNLSVLCQGETVPLPDIAWEQLPELVHGMFEEAAAGGPDIYILNFPNLRQRLEEEARILAQKWNVPAQNSGLSGFDNGFTFAESRSGTALNEEKLVSDILAAFEQGDLNAVIHAEFLEIPPELSLSAAKEQYRTLASFTTETTSNEKRNTNVRLAAEALNGTILQPGEEFSFNAAVGQRTAEKGYQSAAAYSGGEVVQEIGGGVCQISSTLYRAAFQSGMAITYRRSHTFEPNYVTPGQDAAISWGQPDFRFVNTSDFPVGIRASYANRKATVSIYGIPVLDEGITWDLDSEKVGEAPLPEPVYIEDPTLPPATEVVEKAGTPGSQWVTYKVVYQNGVEIQRTEDHSKTYKGHAPVIRRNTSPASETEALPEDYVTDETAQSTEALPDGTTEPLPGETAESPVPLPGETAEAAESHFEETAAAIPGDAG